MSKTSIVERDVEATMRDGVVLRADVYRPDTPEPLPVLLQRTPYGKGFSNLAFALMAAERDYAVVIQDTRGRWASGGDGYPLIHEMEDGYDSVEWVAHQLVDVYPCGYARNVQDGIIRARYRESLDEAKPVTPGEVCEYAVDLAATSNVFQAGHRIRVEISSSNFPRFDRNPNTGHPLGQDAELRPATQTIVHDADHPSHILLPIVPR